MATPEFFLRPQQPFSKTLSPPSHPTKRLFLIFWSLVPKKHQECLLLPPLPPLLLLLLNINSHHILLLNVILLRRTRRQILQTTDGHPLPKSFPFLSLLSRKE